MFSHSCSRWCFVQTSLEAAIRQVQRTRVVVERCPETGKKLYAPVLWHEIRGCLKSGITASKAFQTLRDNPSLFDVSSCGHEISLVEDTIPTTSRASYIRQLRKGITPSDGGVRTPDYVFSPKEPDQLKRNLHWTRRGSSISTVLGSLDLSKPPLTSFDVHKVTGASESDPSEIATENDPESDAYYQERNMPTPQQLKELLVSVTPTFPVPIREWMNHFPTEVLQKVGLYGYSSKQHLILTAFLKRYPTIFKVSGHKLHRKVQLDPRVQHSDVGKGDSLFADFRETETTALEKRSDRKICAILSGRVEPLGTTFISMIEMVNSLAEPDLRVVSALPPERVISLLKSRPDLFQVVTGHPSVQESEYQDLVDVEGSNHPSLNADRLASLAGSELRADAPGAYYVRCRPSSIAPGALGNYDRQSSPHTELLESVEKTISQLTFMKIRRWIRIEQLYSEMPQELKRNLKGAGYKSLVLFLRQHGKVFHVSSDRVSVITHSPETKPPLLLYGDSAESLVERFEVLPRTRYEMLAMDPENPVHRYPGLLAMELLNYLPDHGISVARFERSLPAMLRLAIPLGVSSTFGAYLGTLPSFFSVWWDSETQSRLVKKASLGPPKVTAMPKDPDMLSQELISFMTEPSMKVQRLTQILTPQMKADLADGYGGLEPFLVTQPEKFKLKRDRGGNLVAVEVIV